MSPELTASTLFCSLIRFWLWDTGRRFFVGSAPERPRMPNKKESTVPTLGLDSMIDLLRTECQMHYTAGSRDQLTVAFIHELVLICLL